MSGSTARDVMSTPEAADYLGVSIQFLEIARCKGGGPPYAKVGRLVRYRRSTLDAWLAAREQTSTSITKAVDLNQPQPRRSA